MQVQQPKTPTHLDFIVSALSRRKKQPSVDTPQEIPINKLYETVNNVVSNLDESINECKKYNQAKIHRKYQVVIGEQQKRIMHLQERLKEEQRARSPSKKYLDELLDRLIQYKFQNEAMDSKNKELEKVNEELKKKLKIYEDPSAKQEKQVDQNIQSSSIGAGVSGLTLKVQVSSYLRLKNQFRKHESGEKSKFQRFLIKSKDRLQNWNMRQFLQGIDKWSAQTLQGQNNDDSKIPPIDDFMKKSIVAKMQTSRQFYQRNTSLKFQSKFQVKRRKTLSTRNFQASFRGTSNDSSILK